VPDFPSFSDLFRTGEAEALWRNPRLTREEMERRGSDLNNLMASAAAMGDEIVGQLAKLRKDLYLGTAEDDALDRLILDRYPDLFRKQAAPSYGYVTFSLPSAAAATFVIPDGTVVSSPDTQFIVIGDHNFTAGSTSKTVPIRSTLAGARQKAKSGVINSIISSIPSAPTAITCSNTAATFSGEDKETDADYATRAKRYFLAARRGTLGAIETAALSVPGVVRATAFENYDTLGRPIGYVQLVIADGYTDQFVVTGTPAAYASQAAVLTTAIQSTLNEYRPAGVGVEVTIASVVLQTIRIALAYAAGVDQDAIKAIVRTTIIQYVNNLSPGETLSLDNLREKIRGISGIVYTGNEVLSPTGNVVPSAGQVLRTSLTFTTVD
jgi:uncharacterized phage protein gp47/JayE